MQDQLQMSRAFQLVNEMEAGNIVRRYAVGGAVGAMFYLEPFVTGDIDFFVDLATPPESSLLSLLPLSHDHLTARGATLESEYLVIGDWRVQFLPATTPLEKEALEQAVQHTINDQKVRVITAEYLVAICLQTGRLKDLERVIRFMQQVKLDRPKLNEILARYGLVQKWEKLEREDLPREAKVRDRIHDPLKYRRSQAAAAPERKLRKMESLREDVAYIRRHTRQ
ncbi:MAG TPA: hypothetical protein VFQ00_02170 [Terriglobales bacterium]|nr:hypothetical protein [Terriglobales bacterium]